MLDWLMRLIGGHALRQRDLRLLYAAMFLGELGASSVFPLRLLYAQAHHATPAQLGLMASSFLIAPLVAQVPLGWLVDRWGRVPILMLGMLGHAVVGVCYIVFNSPIDLIALRFLEGVTIAAILPAINAYIADVTPLERRSEAYGVLTAVVNSGLLVGPLLGGVIGQRAGFTTAYLASVGVEVLAIVMLWGRIHEPSRHLELGGSEGEQVASWRRLVSLPLLGAYVAFFTVQIVMGVLSALWTIWIRDLGGSYTYIGATFTVFALPQIFCGAFAGRAADRWGRAPLLLIAGVIASAVYASYGYVTDLVWIMVLGVAEGLAIVFQQPAAQGLLADASPPDVRGRTQGLAGMAGAIGGASAAFVSLPLYHDERALPFIIAGVVMTLGSIVAAASALMLARRRRATARMEAKVAAR